MALSGSSWHLRRDENCFDFLRLAAALAVVYSHSLELVGLHETAPFVGQTAGSIAVALFFSISGFLVSDSWIRDPSLYRFTLRRLSRLVPALLAVAVATAFIIGPACSTRSLREYLSDDQTWWYVPSALLFLPVPPLIGVFESNPYPRSTNSPLWTLRYEILMYGCLALAGSAVRLAWFRGACAALLLLFATLWVLLEANDLAPYKVPFVWRLHTEYFAEKIGYLGAFFFAGACIRLFFSKQMLSMPLGLALVAVAAIIPAPSALMPILWIAIPYAAISFAYRAPPIFRCINGHDYSYGVYVYAFPIQQVVAGSIADPAEHWLAGTAIAAALTITFAAVSWYCLERPMLNRLRTPKSR